MVPLASRTDAFSPVPPMSIASVVGLVPEDPVVGPVAEEPDEPAGCSLMCSLPPPVDGSTRSAARAAGRRSGRSSLSDGRPRGPPRVAMEVFMERDQIVPGGVLVEAGGAAVDRAVAVGGGRTTSTEPLRHSKPRRATG